MAIAIQFAVSLSILGDGTSTSMSLDLDHQPLKDPGGTPVVVSEKNPLTSLIGGAAVITANGDTTINVTASISGTVVTLTFASAPANARPYSISGLILGVAKYE